MPESLEPGDDRLIVRLQAEEVEVRQALAVYLVAGRRVVSDRPVAQLAPWLGNETPKGVLEKPRVGADGRSSGHLIHTGWGLIADAWREVACYQEPCGYRVTVAGVGSFLIGGSGTSIALQEVSPGASDRAIEEALLGPALILSLALRDAWCLHASAVAIGGQAVAFLGESGNGKSTLAAFLASETDLGWQRLADDILPVELTANGFDALPHFPQLKLSPEDQPAGGIPERMPVRAIYVLDGPALERDEIEIRPLGTQEATLAFVRHTIAARLFDKKLLARHLSFCADAAACVLVRRLGYLHDYDCLPAVRDAIAADLERGQ